MKLMKSQIKRFANQTTEQLRALFDAIGTNPEYLVKSGKNKGMVKLKMAIYGDSILSEISRRG